MDTLPGNIFSKNAAISATASVQIIVDGVTVLDETVDAGKTFTGAFIIRGTVA